MKFYHGLSSCFVSLCWLLEASLTLKIPIIFSWVKFLLFENTSFSLTAPDGGTLELTINLFVS